MLTESFQRSIQKEWTVSTHSIAALEAGKPCLIPATALRIMKLINATKQPLQKSARYLGSIFARPIIALLNEQGANGHSLQSTNEYLIESMKLANIVVTAVGSPGLVRAEYLQPHAIVIDVGTTRVNEPRSATLILRSLKRMQVGSHQCQEA